MVKYVNSTGLLVKLTTGQWERYLKLKSRDENTVPEEFGTLLGPCIDVTQWTCGDAEAELHGNVLKNP